MRPDRVLAEMNVSSELAQKWIELKFASPMLDLLDGLYAKVTARKLRIFGMECCRRIKGFQSDEDCAQALQLCEQLMVDDSGDAEAIALREKIEARRLELIRGRGQCPAGMWGLAAAKYLLQTDREYERGEGPSLKEVSSMATSAGVRADRDIQRFEDVRPEDFENLANILNNQGDLLMEVLGNPFEFIDLDERWLSDEVVGLARRIDQQATPKLMSELAAALQQAGCTDERILNHCRLPYQHTRGCWLIDLILGRPTFAEAAGPWEYSLERLGKPLPQAQEVKSLLRQLAINADGTIRSIRPADVFSLANQLAELGLKTWKEYIAVCWELRMPTSREAYTQAVATYDMLRSAAEVVVQIPDLYVSSQFSWRWWCEHDFNIEFGIPEAVHATQPGSGPLHRQRLQKALDQAMRHLPIRYVNLDDHYAEVLPELLSSPAGQALTTLRSGIRPTAHGLEPFQSLRDSGLARTLRRLVLTDWMDEESIRALAEMPFEALEEFDLFNVCGLRCEAGPLKDLMERAWFQRLKSLRVNFRGPGAKSALPLVSRLPSLITLAMGDVRQEVFEHPDQALEFASLKRLYMEMDDIAPALRRLSKYHAPQLIEFSLRSSGSNGKALTELFQIPLLQNISILRLDASKITTRALDALFSSPLSASLQVLQLESLKLKGFSKKSRDLFARAEAFPQLTSLTVSGLYSEPNFADCTTWLSKFNCPPHTSLGLARMLPRRRWTIGHLEQPSLA